MNSQRCQRKKRITNTHEKSSQAMPPSIETSQPSPQPPQQVPLRTNSQMLVDCDEFIDLMTVKRPPKINVIENSASTANKQLRFASCQSPPHHEKRQIGRHQSISSFKAFREDFMENSHLQQQVRKANMDPRHVESDAVQ